MLALCLENIYIFEYENVGNIVQITELQTLLGVQN